MTETTLSEIETLKTRSRYLRGTLLESLADPVTGDLRDDDIQLLKFHGSYRQDDRDLRDQRRRQKLEPDFQYMLRLRLPGGVIAPNQWLALDQVAETFGNSTLRITTRQSVQLHGIRKPRLKSAIAAINQAMLDTYAACGDVNRNVICSVNPAESDLHAEVYAQAVHVSEVLLPQSRAYQELWLDRPAQPQQDNEPVYGENYLPRKFKIAFAIPPCNDVDVFAHDIGFIAVIADGRLTGYNVAVGGGMGMSYGNTDTYPRLASVLGFITPAQVLETALAIVALQHALGNRSDRKRARLKYTIDTLGLAPFQAALEQHLGFSLPAARACHFDSNGDRFGWVAGDNGRWHLTLTLPSGRVADAGNGRWRTGLRAIAATHESGFRLTANQNLIVTNVPDTQRKTIDALVAKHGMDAYRRNSAVRRHALACVAFPTCSLAMAEAERYLPTLLDAVEKLLDQHGLLQQPMVLRLSGCPNGCARPYLGEIALTGKAPNLYNLYLGGSFSGERLASLYRESVNEAALLKILESLFARYAAERRPKEHFGDFVQRSGIVAGGDFHNPAAAT